MHGKTAPAGNAIVVHHAQRAKVYVFRVVVIGKGKVEMGVQPAVVGMAAFLALANPYHGWPPRLLPSPSGFPPCPLWCTVLEKGSRQPLRCLRRTLNGLAT